MLAAYTGQTAGAEQFVLFDQTFTFDSIEAIETKSHLYVDAKELGKRTPKDWMSPVDYRNGLQQDTQHDARRSMMPQRASEKRNALHFLCNGT